MKGIGSAAAAAAAAPLAPAVATGVGWYLYANVLGCSFTATSSTAKTNSVGAKKATGGGRVDLKQAQGSIT
jgi:hypothetical protein